jgi:hypothetical protein
MMTYDIYLGQGTDFNLNIGLTTSSGTPIDLTNCLVSGFIRYSYQTGYLSSLNPSILSPPTSGQISLSVPASGTSIFPTSVGLHEIYMINTGTNTTTKILKGHVYMFP